MEKLPPAFIKIYNEMISLRDNGFCPFCKELVDPHSFKDELSKKEFKISGLCGRCQGDFFTEETND